MIKQHKPLTSYKKVRTNQNKPDSRSLTPGIYYSKKQLIPKLKKDLNL